jgi:PhnB protein
MSVNPIPEGYQTVVPYLAVHDGAAALDFYSRAFGAKELFRMPTPDGKIGHAEMQLGDCRLMLSEPFPGMSTKSPKDLGATTGGLFMYVQDVDAAMQKAVDEGATVLSAAEDMFWGDRFGTVTDPFGHTWSLATHVEDVPPDEMEQRAATAMAAMGG